MLARWTIAAAFHTIYKLDKYNFAYLDHIVVVDAADAQRWLPVLRAIRDNLPLVAEGAMSELAALWKEHYGIEVI